MLQYNNDILKLSIEFALKSSVEKNITKLAKKSIFGNYKLKKLASLYSLLRLFQFLEPKFVFKVRIGD